MKSKFFEKLKINEFKSLHFCVGGMRRGTGSAADPVNDIPCSLDSVEVTKTAVPGQQEGIVTDDLSDWRNECLPDIGGSGANHGIQP